MVHIMASLWKRPNSENYWACFTDANGKRLKRSTGESNRSKAKQIAEAYEAAARTKKTALQVRRTIASLHKQITGEDLASLTVREHSQNWLVEKKGTAPATRAFYQGSAAKFLRFLGPKADADIASIDAKTILDYRNTKTTNHDLKTVKALFKTARRDHLIADDPTEFVETAKTRAERVRRPFTLHEIERVLAVASDEWRSMILFGLYTGLRLSDIATMKWNQIDLQKREVWVTVQKTGKPQLLPLAPVLANHIESLPSSDDPNAPLHSRANGVWDREHRTGRLSNQFANLLVAAGLRTTKPKENQGKGQRARREGKELSFHSLRHTVVSALKEAGVAEAVVMALVGHSSREVSQHYTSVGLDSLKDALAKLPSVS